MNELKNLVADYRIFVILETQNRGEISFQSFSARNNDVISA